MKIIYRRWNHYLVAGKIRLPSGKLLDYYGEIKTHSAISDILVEGKWLDLSQTNEGNGTAKAEDIILVATPYFQISKINAETTLIVSVYYPNQMSLTGKNGYLIKLYAPAIIIPSLDVEYGGAYAPLGTSWHNVIPPAPRHVLYVDTERFYYKQEV